MLTRLVALAAIALCLLVFAVPGQAAPNPQTSPYAADFLPGRNADLSKYKIVFTAQDHASDGTAGTFQDIYTARGDGSNIQRLRPLGDNIFYDWPVWAFNGTRIIFSARSVLQAGGEENLYMMAEDGSELVPLTSTAWRNGQPKLSPDGRDLLFNSAWPEFPEVGIYRLHLETGEVEALSARHLDAANDADPRWAPDGQSILFASLAELKGNERPTQVFRMDPQGNHRERVTTERYFDTDPALSPDGRYMAISSFRGGGHPVSKAARDDDTPLGDRQVTLTDWRLILRELSTNTDLALTAGKDCLIRLPIDACTAGDGPAWVPIWIDGQRLAYISGSSGAGMGIYTVDKDSHTARPVIDAFGKRINWHDWTLADQPPPAPELLSAIHFGPLPPSLLYVGPVYGELPPGGSPPAATLFKSSDDRWLTADLHPTTEDGVPLVPEVAHWSRDKQLIVFSARLPDALIPSVPELETEFAPGQALPGRTQVYVVSADGGKAHQITLGSTEDPLEPITDGEPRSNTDPDFTPDNRYVVFVNRSATESWILRLDLQSGDIVNLTSVNRGVIPGLDARPRVSPDGQRIAFVASLGFNVQVFTMTIDGQDVRQITNTPLQTADPSWSPNGDSLVFSTLLPPGANGASSAGNWSLSQVDLDSGETRALVAGERPLLWPTYSPDGSRIAYIAYGPSLQPDIYVMNADGQDPHPLAITMRTREIFLDWR